MQIIGRQDRIDFPEFGLANIKAKIDTGAFGCALHCHHIEIVSIENKRVLKFKVLDPEHAEYADKVFSSEQFSDKLVKNSGGIAEHRYTINSLISIFGQDFRVEFSLTNRKKMKYPVLLGRKFLDKKFLVDVQQKNLSYKLKLK